MGVGFGDWSDAEAGALHRQGRLFDHMFDDVVLNAVLVLARRLYTAGLVGTVALLAKRADLVTSLEWECRTGLPSASSGIELSQSSMSANAGTSSAHAALTAGEVNMRDLALPSGILPPFSLRTRRWLRRW